MNILVTGGAGYIGSAAAKMLLDSGYSVVVVDNLSKGQKEKVDKRAKFYQLDLTDKNDLEKVFSAHKLDAVMHFAAYKSVEESMSNPQKYSANIIGLVNVLDAMVAHNVKRLVFSSSAAVYGMPATPVADENSPTIPINYYGYTKLVGEQIASQYAQAYGLSIVSLRYFNVVGDAGLRFRESSAMNLLPIIMEVVIGERKELPVYGTDYDTPDGSCVRDYIDVIDLVEAHMLALKGPSGVYNLGTEQGTSVLELIRVTEEVTGKKVPHKLVGRRAGDPAKLVASGAKARKELGWKPKRTIKDSVKSAYEAYKK